MKEGAKISKLNYQKLKLILWKRFKRNVANNLIVLE